MNEKPQKSLKKNALLNVVKTLMGLVFPLVTFPYASRILLPEGLGRVNFATSIISYFILIASLGIENYGIREAAKFRNNRQQLSQFSKEIFIINMTATSIAYLLLMLGIVFITKLAEYKVLLCIISSTILCTTLGVNWLYIAVEDYFYITMRSITFQVLSLVLLFIFVRTSEDYVKYAAISTISNVGSNLLNFIQSRKYISFKNTKKSNFRKHIKPIFVLFFMAIAVKIYTTLDTTMLGVLKGDREVGIYTAATKINKIVLTIVVAITTVFVPRLSYYANKNRVRFNELAYKGFDILLLIAMPCTTGLSFLSNYIINIFCGKEYIDALVPMIIMNPIIIIIGISSYVGINIFMCIGKEIYKLYSSIVGLICNVLLNFVLIPKFGVIGAAIATLISEFLVTGIQLIFLKEILNLSKIFSSTFLYFIDSCIMIFPMYLCSLCVHNQLVLVIISVFLGGFTYLFLLKIQKNNFILEIQHFVRKKNGRK